MRSGKHKAARFSHYVRAHLNDLDRLVRDGFVRPDHGAEFRPEPGGFLLTADLQCEGGILVEVRKLARIVQDDPEDPEVETAWYSYNVSLRGVGAIRRYDSPFAPDPEGHHRYHHVHEYAVLAGDPTGTVRVIEDEDDVPHLGDVVREARDWYYKHLEELQERGLAPPPNRA